MVLNVGGMCSGPRLEWMSDVDVVLVRNPHRRRRRAPDLPTPLSFGRYAGMKEERNSVRRKWGVNSRPYTLSVS